MEHIKIAKIPLRYFGFAVLAILLVGTVSCTKNGKSDLVRRLEAIFYDKDFAAVPEREFRAADYGAVGDGQTLNTKAIQDAIDAASLAGGGVVSFDPGTYLSGALFVKSNVEFFIDEDVTILAVQLEEAYPDVWTRVAGIEMFWPAALINVYQQENVRITGKGTIDGNGKFWWDKFWGDPPRTGGMWTEYNDKGIRWAVDYDCKRVRAVVVYESNDVLLEDFTVKRSGFWTVTLTYSSRVHINGVVVRNNIGGYGPSSDGINTDSSKDILVENCDIDCNDDNLCIKAGRDADGLRVARPSENIVYRNSVTRAGHGLFTLGSETSGGMRNIEVYGLRAEGTNTGIRFKSARVRGGIIEDIWFHDIEMDRVVSPFHFELDWYPAYSYPVIPDSFSEDSVPPHWITLTTELDETEQGIPLFRNLRISHVKALRASNAIYVNAFREKPMCNLQWEDVYIQADKPGVIRHAKNWTMERVTLEVPGPEEIMMKDCENVEGPSYIHGTAGSTGARLPENGGAAIDFQRVMDTLDRGKNGNGSLTVWCRDQVIREGDTLFSDTLRVVIIPGEWEDFRYFEPLGDGFYVTPVELTRKEGQSIFSVRGERIHHWIVYVKSESEPAELPGVDVWKYLPGGQWMRTTVTGSVFTLPIPFS